MNVPKEGDLGELGDADTEFPSTTNGLVVSTRRVGVLAMLPENQCKSLLGSKVSLLKHVKLRREWPGKLGWSSATLAGSAL